MIDYKQIRAGNFILLDTGFFLPQIHEVKAKDIYDISEGKITLSAIEGVPLTPEILNRCGCTQGNDKEMWRNPVGVWLTKVHNKDEYFIQGFRSGHTIKYLHQYQNAVQVLTGEELKFEI